MKARRYYVGILLLIWFIVTAPDALGWGGPGHKFVNKNGVIHLPPTMGTLISAQAYLTDHASDADLRKSTDTAEAPKHFLDLERYPDRQLLTPDPAALINRYGWSTVKSIGLLPWATLWTLDSLTVQMRRGDWNKAYQSAADLGHYVGDAHQPLHCTVNYDGQLTGNKGIHYRYEITTIAQNESVLTVAPDTVMYIADPWQYIIDYIVMSNAMVDSVLQGDTMAKAASGWNGTGTAPASYFTYLWQYTGPFTVRILGEATKALASLWYTAWVNATASGVAVVEANEQPGAFALMQNYPNPFNPATQINYTVGQVQDYGTMGLGEGGRSVQVQLVVYDILGREVKTLVNEEQRPGRYTVRFDGTELASGTYFYMLRAGGAVQTKKLMLLR